jgi:hypothetical protein
MQQDEDSRQIKMGESKAECWDVSSLRFVVDMLQDAGGELIKKTPLADLVKLKQLLINNTGP